MKYENCPECGSGLVQNSRKPKIFCCRKCADKYRHKVQRLLAVTKDKAEYRRLWQRHYRHHMPIEGLKEKECPGCGKIFMPKTRKQKYCHKRCGTLHRNKTTYKWRYSTVFVSKSPENYINSLLAHKGRRKTLSLEYMMGIYHSQRGRCALSGVKMTFTRGKGKVPTNISIDRIDSSKGYVPGNVQLTTTIANMIKNSYSQDDFIENCRRIVEYQEFRKRENNITNRSKIEDSRKKKKK